MAFMEHMCITRGCGWWTTNDNPRAPESCPECGGVLRRCTDEAPEPFIDHHDEPIVGLRHGEAVPRRRR